jgi:hypothetical protein
MVNESDVPILFPEIDEKLVSRISAFAICHSAAYRAVFHVRLWQAIQGTEAVSLAGAEARRLSPSFPAELRAS